MKYILLLIFILILGGSIHAQESYSLYQNHTFRHFDRYVYQSKERFHTSVKPFMLSQVDSVVTLDTLFRIPTQRKAYDIIFNRSLIQFKKDDFAFTVDPLFDFELGQDPDQTDNSWMNTRGIMVNARLGKKVAVSTSFYENQVKFNDYRNQRVQQHGVIPGQGVPKAYKETGYDYGFIDGYVSYAPNKHFDFTFGHGKNFWGDGYRSLILSDNSFNYPYFRITTDFWNIKYVCLWAQFQDLTTHHDYGEAYDKKWGAFHYLDWSVTPWLNIGFFETVIWQDVDSTGYKRGFDFNYANPIIFMRPVEYSVGSPDNSLMGLTGKITLFKKQVFYGQAIIDEFKVEEFTSGNGWWGNKWGVQAGYKTFDVFGWKHLDIQTEFNYVRPFMYTHTIPKSNYGHYQVSLAHPLGTNFWESVTFMRYNYKRLFLEGRYSYALHGSDTAGLNYGNDIYLSYDTHAQEYGNYLGQAKEITLQYASIQAAFLVNPRTNFNVYLNYTLRTETDGPVTINQSLVTFGIRTSLLNFYYDF